MNVLIGRVPIPNDSVYLYIRPCLEEVLSTFFCWDITAIVVLQIVESGNPPPKSLT